MTNTAYLNFTTPPFHMNIEQQKNKDKWAIISVSRQGVDKSLEIVKILEDKSVDIFSMEKYATLEVQPIVGKIADFFGKLMKEYRTILCIMATGIVVRSIAPHLGHKSKDPGILVMDTEGEYVISLLSGHLGSANENARYLSKKIGAQAVITTGTDVAGTLAVDTIAESIRCTITDFTAAKNITALILDHKTIWINNEENVDLSAISFPKNIKVEKPLKCDGTITISCKNKNCEQDEVLLVPKKMVVGIGCRKNTEGDKIIKNVNMLLEDNGIHPASIAYFASIGLKRDEKGIHQACNFYSAEFKVIPDDFVKMVQNKFDASEFVYKTTGLYAVCEPCGYVASRFGECLVVKKKGEGMTLSLWKIGN